MSLLNSHFDCPRDDAPPSSPTKTDIKRDGCVFLALTVLHLAVTVLYLA